ncbi:MAG TPA: ABC transporter permease [Acidobacteriota bacterium]|nr:ABC transporter permease [Acidobacteriota bacterium]
MIRSLAAKVLTRAYSRLLGLWPESGTHRSMRRQQLELFRRLSEDALRKKGFRGLAGTFCASAWDLLVHLPAEHRRASHLPPRPSSFNLREVMKSISLELRQAIRSLRRAPLFSLAVVFTLALGIGANSAIFSIVNGVLLTDLPYESPGQLVRLLEPGNEAADRRPVSYLNFVDWVERSRVFQGAAAFDEWSPNLTGVGEAERIMAAQVNWSFFQVLGVQPLKGRLFREEDDIDGQDSVVILTYGFWQSKFGGRDDVVGREIQLNDHPHQVVGVLGPDFEDPSLGGITDRRLLFRPLGLEGLPPERLPNRGSNSYTGIARLRPEVSLEQAQEALNAVTPTILEENPNLDPALAVVLEPLRESMLGDVRASLWVLMAAVAFLLAIAVVNVANLFLNRGSSRQAEFALRTALGAGRLRLLRHSLIESLVLALAGGAAGLLLALGLMELFYSIVRDFLPRAEQVAIDWRVLLFTGAVSLLTGVAAGLLPAWRSTRREVAESLHDGGRTFSGGLSSSRLRAALVVVQVSLALILLTGSGLLLRSLWNLTSTDTGLSSQGVLTFRVELPRSRYQEPPQWDAFFSQLQRCIESMPSVEKVGRISILPLGGSFNGMSYSPSDQPEPPPGQSPGAQVRSMGGDYFQAMGIRLLSGRIFDSRDHAESPPVAIINRALARRHWPGQDAVSKAIRVAGAEDVEIIGVVDDVKHMRLDEEAPPRIYLSASQSVMSWAARRMTLTVKTSTRPESLIGALRDEVRQMDAMLPVSEVRSMDQVLAQASSASRFRTQLIGGLALLALLLTVVGIYGVISYTVTEGLRAIAIRMALGADRRQIFSGVLGLALFPVAFGLVLGVLGALLNSRLLEGLLYQVGTRDPWPYVAAALLLLAVALAAALLPARRATRTDPMLLLREQG